MNVNEYKPTTKMPLNAAARVHQRLMIYIVISLYATVNTCFLFLPLYPAYCAIQAVDDLLIGCLDNRHFLDVRKQLPDWSL